LKAILAPTRATRDRISIPQNDLIIMFLLSKGVLLRKVNKETINPAITLAAFSKKVGNRFW
jgi:hypothetical protein